MVALILGLSLAGCSDADEQAALAARKTLDDGAVPLNGRESTLTGGFDRNTSQLTEALPLSRLNSQYTEVQTMEAESLRPSEASGCKPDAVKLPSLPATEALATRPPGAGQHQPSSADVVAARARTEPEAMELVKAVRAAAAECQRFSTDLRDLGEGSFAPAEKGSTSVKDASQGEWTGLRTTTDLALTGKGWDQDVRRESLVLSRGQIVVHVQVEGATASEVSSTVDALMTTTISGIEDEPER